MFSVNMLIVTQVINFITGRTNLFCKFLETDSDKEFPKPYSICQTEFQHFQTLINTFLGLFYLPGKKRKKKNSWWKLLYFSLQSIKWRKFVDKELEDWSLWVLKPAPARPVSVTEVQLYVVTQFLCQRTDSVCLLQANNEQKLTSLINLAFCLWNICHLFAVCSSY